MTVQMLAFAELAGFLLVFTLWLQQGQGYSPLQAGMATILFSLGILITPPLPPVASRSGSAATSSWLASSSSPSAV